MCVWGGWAGSGEEGKEVGRGGRGREHIPAAELAQGGAVWTQLHNTLLYQLE